MSFGDVARMLRLREQTLRVLVSKSGHLKSLRPLLVRDGSPWTRKCPEDFVRRAEALLSGLTWLAVVTPESWERLLDQTLSETYLGAMYTTAAELLRPGNKIAFYLSRQSAFIGTAAVSGRPERKQTVWPNAAFSFRVPLAGQVALEPECAVSIRPLLPKLEFITQQENWEVFFRRAIRIIPRVDYRQIDRLVSKHASTGGIARLAPRRVS